jgi:formylmethanofuran dehydrogenase subunit C
VLLRLIARPEVPLEAEVICPDRLRGLGAGEVARLPVWHGNREVALGEFFSLEGSDTSDLSVEGDLGRVKLLGAGMTFGRVVVAGPAGMHAGARMGGGELLVEGDVAGWAGAEMTGGRLTVMGNAGDHLGGAYPGSRAGMRGGEIAVHGDAGEEAGAGLRRGLIAVGGRCGDFGGWHMLAGTLVALGGFGRRAGAGMRRGTLVSMRRVEMLPTFTAACAYQPPFLALYLRRLRALGLPVTAAHESGTYRRWSGDSVEGGRGEILVLEDGA